MPVTKQEIAAAFLSSFTAALAIARASGGTLDVEGIARASANNAAMVVALDVYERGVEEP